MVSNSICFTGGGFMSSRERLREEFKPIIEELYKARNSFRYIIDKHLVKQEVAFAAMERLIKKSKKDALLVIRYYEILLLQEKI